MNALLSVLMVCGALVVFDLGFSLFSGVYNTRVTLSFVPPPGVYLDSLFLKVQGPTPGEIRWRRRPTEVATLSRAEALRESPAGLLLLLPKPDTPRVVYLIHCTLCPHG